MLGCVFQYLKVARTAYNLQTIMHVKSFSNLKLNVQLLRNARYNYERGT